MKIMVNDQKCPQNHKCPSISVCPVGAITQADIHALPQVDAAVCILCRKCMRSCPKGAFELVGE